MSNVASLVRKALSFSPRRVLTVIGLAAVWCAMWGTVSFANVMSGLLIGVVVTVQQQPDARGIRLVPLAKFVGLVIIDLARATKAVAWEVLTPTDYTDEVIIGVKVPMSSRRHLLALTTAITVTPGTAVVEADADTNTLYLHVLHRSSVDDVTEHVRQLADLACAALPDGEPFDSADDTSSRTPAPGGAA